MGIAEDGSFHPGLAGVRRVAAVCRLPSALGILRPPGVARVGSLDGVSVVGGLGLLRARPSLFLV